MIVTLPKTRRGLGWCLITSTRTTPFCGEAKVAFHFFSPQKAPPSEGGENASHSKPIGLYHPNVRQVAKLLLVVETVPHDEFIRNLETDIFEIEIDNPARSPIQQRANLDRAGISAQQGSHQISHRKTGIDDVFNQQDILSGDILFEIFRDPNNPLAPFAITRYREEIHRQRKGDVASQIGGKEDRTAQYRNENEGPPRIVRTDLSAKRRDSSLNFFFCKQHLNLVEHAHLL